MKTTIWILTAGGQDGQETSEEKRQAGYEYIDRLSQDETIINVVDDGKKFTIYTE